MKELYIEGLAIHGDPQLCVGDPQGRSEALARARAGQAIEPRNDPIRGAHAVSRAEGNTVAGVTREPTTGPAWSKNHGMCGNSMRENREIPCLPAGLIARRAAQARPRP
jgi:hypothetical protein